MSAKHTNDEWLALFTQAEKGLSDSPIVYSIPQPGSDLLAMMIDHTLLKLDATEQQIDALCKEAREFKFKASDISFMYFALPSLQTSMYLIYDYVYLVL